MKRLTLRTSAAAAACVVIMGLSACSDDSSSGDNPSGTGDSTASSSTSTEAGDEDGTEAGGETFTQQPGQDIDLRTSSFPVSAAKAVATATDEVGSQGTLHAVELDHSDSDQAWQWDVKILQDGTDHKVVIDAITGDVVRQEKESSDDTEKAIDLDDPMTFDEALDLATEQRDGQLREWKLEYDDGRRAYQFDIAKDGTTEEVTVDVDSGEVTVD